jgi:DNA-binding PadR family transcriptional regulator
MPDLDPALQPAKLTSHEIRGILYLNDIFVERYMSAGSRDFRHFILGLLFQQPMSGYDVKQYLENLGWLVGNPSFGAIYPALHALLEDGFVSLQIEACENKPPRKIYTITATGKHALDEWIHQPLLSGASSRAFVMRLLLATHLSQEGLVAHLQQRRQKVAEQRAALKQTIGESDPPTDIGQRLAFDYGMTIASTELAWLEDLIATLDTQYAPKELVGKGK